MIGFPPCKINLGLNVLHRRTDGYHDIETCFYPLPRTDIIEVVPAASFHFELSGIDIPGLDNDNLCVKAYEMLRKDHSLPPVAIYLHKLIPTGAGLGGGSSDGTATLRLLNQVFNLNLSTTDLASYAARLGSDCAFFLHDQPMIGTGRGEKLSPVRISLKGLYIIMVRPDIHVSTQSAYQSVTPRTPDMDLRSIVEGMRPEEWRDKLTNQFEPLVMSKYPVIGRVREDLYHAGALYSSMSGSGSAVYGLFNMEKDLSRAFAGMDYWAGRL
jgi:4-diphosphocytidyl-2-C-methyl-D-erythritol kinase